MINVYFDFVWYYFDVGGFIAEEKRNLRKLFNNPNMILCRWQKS